jgi:hypothetical protein
MPKPQNYISKNMNNIQSSVQSFKPQQNNNSNQLEVYDSSQEYPLSGQNNSSGNNSNNNSMDFNSVVKIITSLSESVSLMVNKIETFKGNVEDRLNKLEAEIVLIKNKQNYLDSRLNSQNNNNNVNSNNIDNLIITQKNNNSREKNNMNINRINNNNFNNNISKESNSINNNNIYIQDSTNDNNNYLKNNQIFTSFAPEIRTNSGYEQSYPEEKKVYNVFNYNKENENGINDINNNMNKYADIDKLIENSEKNFFKTQKLLEDYDNTDISKKKPNL